MAGSRNKGSLLPEEIYMILMYNQYTIRGKKALVAF